MCVACCVCSEVASFSEALEEKEREHKTEVEAMTNNRVMLEVSSYHLTLGEHPHFVWL